MAILKNMLLNYALLQCFTEYADSGLLTVEILTLGFREPVSYSSLAFSAPAVDSAVLEIQKQYGESINFRHTYLYLENSDNSLGTCRTVEFNASYALSKWYYSRPTVPDLTALIAPGCDESLELNRLASSWNVLMITSSSSFVEQRNKTISPTWIATVPTSPTSYLLLVKNVFNHFNWTTLFILRDEDASRSYRVGVDALRKYLPKLIPGFQLVVRRIHWSRDHGNSTQILREFNATSRVMFFLSHSDNLRTFLLRAHSLNMTNGDYVYVAQESFHDLNEFGNFSWRFGDRYDADAKEAYRSLILAQSDPVIYEVPSVTLVNKWREQSKREFNYTYKADESILPAVTATYLGIKIFGKVVNDLYNDEPEFDWSDGATIAAQFFDSKYHFNFTDVYIDISGERSVKCTVNDLNPYTGQWEKVMEQDESSRTLRQVKPMDWGGFRYSNQSPSNEPECGYRGDRGPCAFVPDAYTTGQFYGMVVGILSSVLLVGSAVLIYVFRQIRYMHQLRSTWWLLDRSRLQFLLQNSSFCKPPKSTRSVLDSTNVLSRSDITTIPRKGPAKYKGMDVWADRVYLPESADKVFDDGDKLRQHGYRRRFEFPKESLKMLKTIKDAPPEYINKFIGICGFREHRSLFLVSSFCSKGSLHDLFGQPFFKDQLRLPFILDLIEGLYWIHSSALQFHGLLTGWNCLIDRHFSLKIARFGYYHMLTYQSYGQLQLSQRETDASRKFWTAPEILRKEAEPSSLTDIYALGIIFNEIIWNALPYAEYSRLPASEVLSAVGRVQGAVMRPTLVDDGPLAGRLNPVIETCWAENPKDRPNITTIREEVAVALDLKGHRRNLLEDIWSRLETHAETLEIEVTSRTNALIAERKRCDRLLQEMLPKYVVEQLRVGHAVHPETFDSVTILFTSIYGFDEFAGMASPSNITDLLNDIYSLFDKTLHCFDVYKVETVLETYMVSSGVPVRNVSQHASEICSFVVILHDNFMTYSEAAARQPLQLRSGANSGPCVAAVVGHQKPRYCLYGDTVNTASRMETTGEPSRIQISASTAALLKDKVSAHFAVSLRGYIPVKGKDYVLTYWLDRHRTTPI